MKADRPPTNRCQRTVSSDCFPQGHSRPMRLTAGGRAGAQLNPVEWVSAPSPPTPPRCDAPPCPHSVSAAPERPFGFWSRPTVSSAPLQEHLVVSVFAEISAISVRCWRRCRQRESNAQIDRLALDRLAFAALISVRFASDGETISVGRRLPRCLQQVSMFLVAQIGESGRPQP